MNEHESYVSLETARMLKEAGFDWECRKCYDGEVMFDMEPDEIRKQCPQHSKQDIPAPTLEVAQRWLREVKSIFISISSGLKEHMVYDCKIVDWRRGYNENYYMDETFNTCEEAQEAGIKKALELILEKGE